MRGGVKGGEGGVEWDHYEKVLSCAVTFSIGCSRCSLVLVCRAGRRLCRRLCGSGLSLTRIGCAVSSTSVTPLTWSRASPSYGMRRGTSRPFYLLFLLTAYGRCPSLYHSSWA